MNGTIETLRPDRDYLLKLYAATLVVFVIFFLPLILLGLVPELGLGYILIFIAANALWLVPTFILLPFYYRSISYELRADEIVVYKGVITKSTKVVPYRTVTNLDLKRDPFDRFLRLGTLRVETAGMSGQTGAEISLVGMSDYEGVQRLVREQLRRYRASYATTTEGGGAAERPSEALTLLLEEVREIKEIIQRK